MTNIIQLSDHRPKPEAPTETIAIIRGDKGELVLSDMTNEDTIKMLKRAILIVTARAKKKD